LNLLKSHSPLLYDEWIIGLIQVYIVSDS
jgi:hypothetical protein